MLCTSWWQNGTNVGMASTCSNISMPIKRKNTAQLPSVIAVVNWVGEKQEKRAFINLSSRGFSASHLNCVCHSVDLGAFCTSLELQQVTFNLKDYRGHMSTEGLSQHCYHVYHIQNIFLLNDNCTLI